jgi:hypothetical protein
MALKTFNLDEETYKEFSDHCKSEGISMSKKVENFIKTELNKLRAHPPKKTPKNVKPGNHPLSKYC